MPGADVSQPALLGPADIRALAERLGLRPTKKLGQNFVHDANTVRRIVNTAELAPDDVVLEVGPGLGSLTCALLPAVSRVHAVEIDETLAEQLPLTVADRAPGYASRLNVLRDNAMRLSASWFDPAPTMLVANLPYNVAVPIVLHAFAELPSLRGALVMVQAEVADRMVAEPGSRIYGVPSVKLAWYGRARRAGAVGRKVFWPEPNVDSALVRIERGAEPAGVRREAVFAVVESAFAQRRKMIRTAISDWLGGDRDVSELLASAGVDPTVRAERLGLDDYVRIVRARKSLSR